MSALPRDAVLVELRPEALTFRTREVVLPGTPLEFDLVMEGHPLSLQAPVEACLVVEKDKTGYTLHCRVDLLQLSESDRQLVSLFIGKGRGSPTLHSTAVAK